MNRVRKIGANTGRAAMTEGRLCFFAEEAVVDCPATWLPCSGSVLPVRMEDDPPGEVRLCEGHIEKLEEDDVKLRVLHESRPAI
jgi:hypothetical protein